MKIILLLIATVLLCSARAEVPAEFDDPQRQQRYQSLLKEIRCLVCQNQSLADSNAELAQDLRNEVHRMVAEDESNQVIIDYLVARYGDFVLYRPPLKATTLLLWFGPFVLLLAALVAIYRFVKSARVEEISITDEDKARLAHLMNDTDKK